MTKYRRAVFDDAIPTRCEEIMRQVRHTAGAHLTEFNGEPDHVHPLVHHPPKASVPLLVNRPKGASARYLRQEYNGHMNRAITHGHPWSPFHFAASRGGAPLPIIKQYIDQQKRPQ